jgi:hypothetical protein
MAPGAFDADAEQLRRRKAFADLLTQQGQQPLQGQMVSGHYVAPSWTQQLARGLNTYLGAKENKTVADEMQKLGEQRRGESVAESQKLADAMFGRQAQTIQPATPNDDEGNANAPVQVPAQQRDLAEALRIAQNSRNPGLQHIGAAIPGMIQQERTLADNRAARAAELKLRTEENARLQQERIQAQQEAARERQQFAAQQAAAQREQQAQMARLQASLRPEPMMTVLGPQGEPVSLPRSQAAGMTPYNPTAAKQIQAEAKQKTAKGEVNEIVSQLAQSYDTLKKEGGVTSTGGGMLTNLGARLGNTSVGQVIGSVAGTKSQQARDTIAQTRPLLLNAIKNATGMSAQQMNSNAEMQLYLKAATDPALGYEANLNALRNLDKLYGLGLVGAEAAPAQVAASGMPSQSAIDAEIARRRGGK